MVFLEDFFVFGLELAGSVVVLSVAVSLFGAVSVFASDFFELLFVLFDDGLVALSAAGLFVVEAGLFVVEALLAGVAVAFAVALVDGVIVAATDAVAAGVIVAAALADAAGLALALVEAALFVVVVAPVVVVPVVVPVVEVTPTLKLGVTP